MMHCTHCDMPITNPVCQDCLGAGIAQWLQSEAPERIPALHEETAWMARPEGITCIRCKHAFSTCPYCYTKHICNWLRDGRLQVRFFAVINFLT